MMIVLFCVLDDSDSFSNYNTFLKATTVGNILKSILIEKKKIVLIETLLVLYYYVIY